MSLSAILGWAAVPADVQYFSSATSVIRMLDVLLCRDVTLIAEYAFVLVVGKFAKVVRSAKGNFAAFRSSTGADFVRLQKASASQCV